MPAPARPGTGEAQRQGPQLRQPVPPRRAIGATAQQVARTGRRSQRPVEPGNRFSVLAEPEGPAAPASLPHESEVEPLAPVAVAPDAPGVSDKVTGQLLAGGVADEEALLAAAEEATAMAEAPAAVEAASAVEAAPAGEAGAGTPTAARRGQVDSERRRRSKVVQTIALCERLGLKYSDAGAKRALCAPRRRKKEKKPPLRPPMSAAPDPPAAGPPDALQAMAEENARLLSRVGWRKLAKRRRGRSAISDDVGSLPHKAAG